MKFEGIIPVIQCLDIEQSMVFYQQAFRYIVINKREGAHGLEWVHMKSDDTYLMLTKQQNGIAEQIKKNDSILLYYYTDDIDAQYRFIKAKGFEVTEISTTKHGMKEFFISDLDGNRLAVGQQVT